MEKVVEIYIMTLLILYRSARNCKKKYLKRNFSIHLTICIQLKIDVNY